MIDPIIIILALAAGLLIRQLGYPPMLGYLVAGFAISQMPIEPGPLIEQIANAGVTLLLFTIGLKLNLRDLAAVQVWGVAAGVMVVVIPLFALALMLLLALVPALSALEGGALWTVAFALSFSSTVFAVKVFDERGEGASLHAKIAIGILIVQDLVAVVFLALSTGKLPEWPALLLLLLIPLRPVLHRLFALCGHGELLTLFGIGLAFGGYGLFEYFNIKGDLGALIFGVLLGGCSKTSELRKILLNLKELFLVGFFVSIGLNGLPSMEMCLLAVALALLAAAKPVLYYLSFVATRLRARTSFFASLSLHNHSEFGLFVAFLAADNGVISSDWVIIIALAMALSFFVAVPFNARSHKLYRRYREHLFEREKRLPFEQPVELGNATMLVMGMGRVGRGAYDHLKEIYGDQILGVDSAQERLPVLKELGYRAACGDATDRAFWECIDLGNLKIIMLCLPDHPENYDASQLLKSMGYGGQLAAIARFPDDMEELTKLGCISFNLYAEGGYGFAEHVVERIG
ncbi:cation:proton antiporter [Porticoccus sp. W117]|uniref:cation:proton antiporter family protein n=1 Tax=Porticoccus sp. W117 TaxID=3054777 RepID=UPI0025977447|nr:cation:proton antiporter family protein [Porticoccus sp. W117]MDM3872192.1 cation:proton antiporter [Porticoccus sp. W117]